MSITTLDVINSIASCFAAIGTVGATIFALYSACGPHLGKLKVKFRPQYDKDDVLSSLYLDLRNTGKEDITLFHILVEAHNKTIEGDETAHIGILIDTAELFTEQVKAFLPMTATQSKGITIKANSILTLTVIQGKNCANLQEGHIINATITDSRGKKRKSYKIKVKNSPKSKN